MPTTQIRRKVKRASANPQVILLPTSNFSFLISIVIFAIYLLTLQYTSIYVNVKKTIGERRHIIHTRMSRGLSSAEISPARGYQNRRISATDIPFEVTSLPRWGKQREIRQTTVCIIISVTGAPKEARFARKVLPRRHGGGC